MSNYRNKLHVNKSHQKRFKRVKKNHNNQRLHLIELIVHSKRVAKKKKRNLQLIDKMSVSSPEVSLSSSSTTSSSTKDDVDYWEVNPPPTPATLERLASLDGWDYSIELDCLKGPEGFTIILYSIEMTHKFFYVSIIVFFLLHRKWKTKPNKQLLIL